MEQHPVILLDSSEAGFFQCLLGDEGLTRILAVESALELLAELVARLFHIVGNDALKLLDSLVELGLVETWVCKVQVGELQGRLQILGRAASGNTVTQRIDIRSYRDILACKHLGYSGLREFGNTAAVQEKTPDIVVETAQVLGRNH